jgi:hypothetical protein
VDVAEAASRREARGSGLWITNGATGGKSGCSNHGDIGAVGVVGREDILIGTQAGAITVRNTSITAGEDDRHTLQAKFHEFVALAQLVVGWVVSLNKAIRKGDDIRWFIGPALLLSLRINGIDIWIISSLSIG